MAQPLHELHLGAGIASIGFGYGADVAPVGLHDPGVPIRRQLQVQHGAQALSSDAIFDRHQHFDSTLQVTLHGVRRADEIFLGTTVVEVVDAAVLQEASDDADHAHVVREPGQAGP